MKFVENMLQRRLKHHFDRYEGVLAQLEDAFADYEDGRATINGYLDAVGMIDRHIRRERPLWLRLCDWSLALRWCNKAERRAFLDVCDALEWCRNWAIRQRGVDVTACLERAGAGTAGNAAENANDDTAFSEPLGVAA